MSYLAPPCRADRAARHIGRCAVRALYRELILYPKPGLVSPVDSGAHDDMDAASFLRSLFALRHYFIAIAAAGAAAAPFEILRQLGLQAEHRMLAATGGVNTHRGAIFCLGLLAAAAGRQSRLGGSLRAAALAGRVTDQWGDGLRLAGQQSAASHGAAAVRRYGVRGARDEALDGFPTLLDIALPAMSSRQDGKAAATQTLFAVMASLQDTNLLHRGGVDGLNWVQGQAALFLARGGVDDPGWRDFALSMHRGCVARRLSPGGSADLLAATWFVRLLQP
jgi:triphosphoribosyl-dephospho-CoA synthase